MPNADLGPLPSQDEWEERVRAAMAATGEFEPKLRWTSRSATLWDLNGDCPRCRHTTSTVMTGGLVSDTSLEGGELVELILQCSCEEDAISAREGCGAGAGLYIRVPGPVR